MQTTWKHRQKATKRQKVLTISLAAFTCLCGALAGHWWSAQHDRVKQLTHELERTKFDLAQAKSVALFSRPPRALAGAGSRAPLASPKCGSCLLPMRRKAWVTMRLLGVRMAPTSGTCTCWNTSLENSGAHANIRAMNSRGMLSLLRRFLAETVRSLRVLRVLFKDHKWTKSS